MRRITLLGAAIAACLAVVPVAAQEYGTAKEAETMVKAAVTHIKKVGKEMIDLKDPDGKPFVKERVELAKSNGTFWQD